MLDSKDDFLKNRLTGENAIIKVIGVGGGGNNAVNRMIEDQVCDVEYITVNTDYNVLAGTKTDKQIQLGQKLTRGLGAGGQAEIGKKAAEESAAEIDEFVDGADIVFITAGMGGGTGTGAAPVIAGIAKNKGILTVGVVTKPFRFEGRKRMRNAVSGIVELKKNVDTLIVIPNQKLTELSDGNTTFQDSFRKADEVLRQCVSGIANIIRQTGDINVDFADVTSTMKDKGIAHMGVGNAAGKNKTEMAVQMAIDSPLLETSVKGAKNILVNFILDETSTLTDVEDAVDLIHDLMDEEAEVFFGVKTDSSLTDEVRVTVIATDLDDNNDMYVENQQEPSRRLRPSLSEPIQNNQYINQQQQNQNNQYINQQQNQNNQYVNQQQQNQNSQDYSNSEYIANNRNIQNNNGYTQTTDNFSPIQQMDTMPNVQPVSYNRESRADIKNEVKKRGGFKIHDAFLGNNKLSDLSKRD